MTWTADGSALSDHASFVRLLNEGGAGKRGNNLNVAGRHGEWSDYDKPYSATDLLLEVAVKKDTPREHLSELQLMLGKTTGFVTLQRVLSYQGTVSAEVELLAPPQPTQDRFTYLFQMRNPSGFWRDASATTASGTAPAITTLGDRPVDDMVVTFSGPGTATHVEAGWGTATLAWQGTGTAIFDMGSPRSVTKAGANAEGSAVVSSKWWLRFAPNTTQNLTSTVSITVDYRNKWS